MKYWYLLAMMWFSPMYCAEPSNRITSPQEIARRYSFEELVHLSPPGTPIPVKKRARAALSRSFSAQDAVVHPLNTHDAVVQSLVQFCKEHEMERETTLKIVNPAIVRFSKSDSSLEKSSDVTP